MISNIIVGLLTGALSSYFVYRVTKSRENNAIKELEIIEFNYIFRKYLSKCAYDLRFAYEDKNKLQIIQLQKELSDYPRLVHNNFSKDLTEEEQNAYNEAYDL